MLKNMNYNFILPHLKIKNKLLYFVLKIHSILIILLDFMLANLLIIASKFDYIFWGPERLDILTFL
jgi:hypothetical protein